MQFLRIAAVLSLVAAVGTEVRAEWFSINNAISQAVLTNPAVGEASANRRATEAELRQTQGTEVNAIVPHSGGRCRRIRAGGLATARPESRLIHQRTCTRNAPR